MAIDFRDPKTVMGAIAVAGVAVVGAAWVSRMIPPPPPDESPRTEAMFRELVEIEHQLRRGFTRQEVGDPRAAMARLVERRDELMIKLFGSK